MPLSRVINVLLFCAALVGSSAGVAAVTAEPAPSAGAGAAAAAQGTTAAAVPSAAAGTSAGAPAVRKPAQRASRAGRPAATPTAGGGVAAPGPASAPAPVAPPAPGPAPVDGPAGGGLVYIGSVSGGYDRAVAATGGPLAEHAYADFRNRVPEAEMITVSAGNTKWRDVAAAAPGSALHGQIVTWARTIAARGGSVMVAYNHEPEAHDRLTLGSAAEFIAAWRHVRAIFDQQGATNVEWTWQMTAYSFRVPSSNEQAAARWYPGDDVVDNIGADAYNWHSCGANAPNPYNEMAFLGDPVLAFARAHGKAASFPEFASHAAGNRTQWLANAHEYFVRNRDVLTAAFYFNRPPTIAKNADCTWALAASSEFGALRTMAQDTAHFRV